MSQMTATARVAPARPSRAPRATPRPRLRVVDAAPMPASHMGYGLLCAALVVAGLLTMLLLNIGRAEGSLHLSTLQAQSAQLEAEHSGLTAELTRLSSPEALAAAATDLGMVASPSTAVLRLSDGAVLGVAAGVDDQGTFTVDLPLPSSEGAGDRSTDGGTDAPVVEDLQAEG